MTKDSIDTTGLQPAAEAEENLFDVWLDPIDHAVRDRARYFHLRADQERAPTVLAHDPPPTETGVKPRNRDRRLGFGFIQGISA